MPALAEMKEQGPDRQSARVGLKISQPIQAPYLHPPVFRPLVFISPLLKWVLMRAPDLGLGWREIIQM